MSLFIMVVATLCYISTVYYLGCKVAQYFHPED